MISKKHIQKFLGSTSTESVASYKELTPEQLDRRLAPFKVDWLIPPMYHQKVGVLAGLERNTVFLLYDPGLGKTYTALQILRARKAAGQVKKTLVLVPGVTNIGAWEEEIRTYAPELTYKGFYKLSKVDKEIAVNENYDIIIMTYMGWLSLLGASKRKGKQSYDFDYMESIESLFQMVIWDESDALKNKDSKSTKLAFRLTFTTPYRLCLSGTPFDKNPIDLWSQFYLLDQGACLGETLTLFRDAFCIRKINRWSGGFDYVFDTKKTDILAEKVKTTAVIFYERDCLDLPKTIGGILSSSFMLRSAPFPEENQKMYDKILQDIRPDADKSVIRNSYARMRQATAGYVTINHEDSKSYIEFTSNPKLEALFALLEEIPLTDKIIVYTEYIQTGNIVTKAIEEKGHKLVRVYSETKDKIAAINQFKTDPETRILVGSRSVCYGLNIQGANRLILFESPDSTIKRQQLERRIRRNGQTKVTYIYDIAVYKSVDEKILNSLRSGKDLIDDILASDDPTKLLI